MTEPAVSATQLLDREVSEEQLRESTAQVAVERVVVEPGKKSIVIFRIGKEWLALPTDVFQEVAEPCKIHTLPHRRGGILSGLVSVRGELLICVALNALLGIETVNESSSNERLMVCNRKGSRLAFSVAAVHGVHRYHPRDLRPVPSTLAQARAGTYTLGIVLWNERTVGCLDDELLFYALNKGLS